MTRSFPTVSVVIPCYNQARYLRDAIRSVRQQTQQPIECIVVDDGSTDGTSEVAAGLGAHVIHQANGGVSAARNAGLSAARGELVVFLDADDVLLPAALARGLSALVAQPGVAAVVSRCEVMDEQGTFVAARHHEVEPSNLYRGWLLSNFVWTPGAAISGAPLSRSSVDSAQTTGRPRTTPSTFDLRATAALRTSQATACVIGSTPAACRVTLR